MRLKQESRYNHVLGPVAAEKALPQQVKADPRLVDKVWRGKQEGLINNDTVPGENRFCHHEQDRQFCALV